MQDEELFIGGYIIQREDEKDFTIQSTLSGRVLRISEERLTMKIAELWMERAE